MSELIHSSIIDVLCNLLLEQNRQLLAIVAEEEKVENPRKFVRSLLPTKMKMEEQLRESVQRLSPADSSRKAR